MNMDHSKIQDQNKLKYFKLLKNSNRKTNPNSLYSEEKNSHNTSEVNYKTQEIQRYQPEGTGYSSSSCAQNAQTIKVNTWVEKQQQQQYCQPSRLGAEPVAVQPVEQDASRQMRALEFLNLNSSDKKLISQVLFQDNPSQESQTSEQQPGGSELVSSELSREQAEEGQPGPRPCKKRAKNKFKNLNIDVEKDNEGFKKIDIDIEICIDKVQKQQKQSICLPDKFQKQNAQKSAQSESRRTQKSGQSESQRTQKSGQSASSGTQLSSVDQSASNSNKAGAANCRPLEVAQSLPPVNEFRLLEAASNSQAKGSERAEEAAQNQAEEAGQGVGGGSHVPVREVVQAGQSAGEAASNKAVPQPER